MAAKQVYFQTQTAQRTQSLTMSSTKLPVQGCEYVFIDNVAPGAGRVRNAGCVGRRIDLDPREPEDDITQPFRILRYPPLCVWVQPLETPAPLGTACGPLGPPDCIPITPATATATVDLPAGDRPTVNNIHYHRVACTRTTFPLGDAYCVTDYYAQGMSFRDACWLAHLTPPPDRGAMKRASLLVTHTRFRNWEALQLWAPLWGSETERKQVIDRFHRCIQPKADLTAELSRLERLAIATLAAYPPSLAKHLCRQT